MSEQKRKLTIAETLLASELPEDVKAAAIANHRALGQACWSDWESTQDDSAVNALACAFTWKDSEDGVEYWNDWWRFLVKKENETPKNSAKNLLT